MHERIKELRQYLNLNQTEFSKRIGITQPSLSDIEKGKTANIDARTIKILCQEFNVNEEWIRTGQGEMFKTEGEFLELFASKLDDLDELDRKIISEYIRLSPEQRIVIKDFIKKMNT
ncbi:MAG TPA: helix-turn-helix transcriptional regulator [Clostridia bacterium]